MFLRIIKFVLLTFLNFSLRHVFLQISYTGCKKATLFASVCFSAQMVLNIFIGAGVQNCSNVNIWRIGQRNFELTILKRKEKKHQKKNPIKLYIFFLTINIPKGPPFKLIKLSRHCKLGNQFTLCLFIWLFESTIYYFVNIRYQIQFKVFVVSFVSIFNLFN